MSQRDEAASDEALLDAARAGDKAAIEALLERNRDRIYAFGMRMCGNPEDASDVLQETLLALARGIETFRGAASLSSWLYAVARSFCIKKRRRGKSVAGAAAHDSPHPERLTSPAPTPESALARRELRDALSDALAALEPSAREVLILRDMEGLRTSEVAEVLGTSVDAVKSRLHRARVSLRERLAPVLADEPRTPATAGCPDILLQFSKNLEGDVDAATCAAMERHVASCARCRNTCDALKETLALCRTSPAPKVPEDVARAVREAVREALTSLRG